MSGRALHEINVIGTMNLLAAAGAPGSSVRKVVVKSLDARLRRERPRTRLVPRGDDRARSPPRTRVERSLLEVEGYLRDFAEDNPHVVVTLLRFSNVLGTDIDTPFIKALRAAGRAARSSASTRGCSSSHEDDVVRSIEFVHAQRRARHLQRRRRRQAAVERGVRDRAASAASPLPPVAHRARRRAARHRCASSTCRPRCSTCCATAAASTTAGSSGPGSATATRRPARSRPSPQACGCGAPSATASPTYRYERDVETSSATPPPSSGPTSAADQPPR